MSHDAPPRAPGPPAVRRWASLTWEEFGSLDPETTVAVLPVAAIEQHGPHLPLDVDARIVEAAVDAAAARVACARVLLLPAQTIGASDEHAAFPGTLTLDVATLARTWFAIGEGVHRAGVRKVALVNAHGGQPHVARMVAQDMRLRLGMMAAVADTYGFGVPDGLFDAVEREHGIHGGAIETSLMLHLAPEGVRLDRLADFRPASIELASRTSALRFHGRGALAWATQDLHPLGACGDARRATAAAGEAILAHIADGLAEWLDALARHPLSALRDGPRGAPAGDASR